MTQLARQPWLHSAAVDSTFILAPAFLASAIAWLCHDSFNRLDDIPLWAWVSLVLCIDVAHVYATLFRTYWHPVGREQYRPLLLSAPLLVWISGTLLYAADALLFWRVLAYLAVFHFIRQQYGFVRLYSRGEQQAAVLGIRADRIDQWLVYAAALFPLICWHTQLPRRFHWFVDGDFIDGLPAVLASTAALLYVALIALWLTKEVRHWQQTRTGNLPKTGVILGTACSWFIGIVAFNNDMAFTLTNVVSHGIPYMALTWIYNRRDRQRQQAIAVNRWQGIAWLPASFVLTLVALAFVEEGLWDGLVWREHSDFFALFRGLPAIHQHALLAALVPLLTVPQATHYILDGVIWKSRPR